MSADKAIENQASDGEAYEGKTIEDLFDLVSKAERRSQTFVLYSAPRERAAVNEMQSEVVDIDDRYPFLLGAA